MSTWSLLRWVALVAGAELAVRGHLADRGWICHGGAALFALALAAITWPTRARRAGVAAALAIGALAAVDAAWPAARPSAEPPGSAPAPSEARDPVVADTPFAPAPANGSAVVLLFAGAPRVGGEGDGTFQPIPLRDALRRHLACPRDVAVVGADARGAALGGVPALERAIAHYQPDLVLVGAGAAVLDAVLEEDRSLRFPPLAPIGARASVIGSALEARLRAWIRAWRWRRAVAVADAPDPRRSPVAARYRELVLAARRAEAEVALLVPGLAAGVDAPEAALRSIERRQPDARSRILANRAHALLVRAIAGSYGIRALDARPDRADAAAQALAAPLARHATGCEVRAQGRSASE